MSRCRGDFFGSALKVAFSSFPSSLACRTSSFSPLKVKRVRSTSLAGARSPLISIEVASHTPCRSSLSAPAAVGAGKSRATQTAAGTKASAKAFMMYLLETIRLGRLTRALLAGYEGEEVRTAERKRDAVGPCERRGRGRCSAKGWIAPRPNCTIEETTSSQGYLMTGGLASSVRGYLRRLAGDTPSADTDGALLARFVAARDEAAFAALLVRHGAMILRVCERVLGPGCDAEDAFQATFLLLVDKAATLRRGDSLGSWLHTA